MTGTVECCWRTVYAVFEKMTARDCCFDRFIRGKVTNLSETCYLNGIPYNG